MTPKQKQFGIRISSWAPRCSSFCSTWPNGGFSIQPKSTWIWSPYPSYSFPNVYGWLRPSWSNSRDLPVDQGRDPWFSWFSKFCYRSKILPGQHQGNPSRWHLKKKVFKPDSSIHSSLNSCLIRQSHTMQWRASRITQIIN